jgi:hypothetical protein
MARARAERASDLDCAERDEQTRAAASALRAIDVRVSRP